MQFQRIQHTVNWLYYFGYNEEWGTDLVISLREGRCTRCAQMCSEMCKRCAQMCTRCAQSTRWTLQRHAFSDPLLSPTPKVYSFLMGWFINILNEHMIQSLLNRCYHLGMSATQRPSWGLPHVQTLPLFFPPFFHLPFFVFTLFLD